MNSNIIYYYRVCGACGKINAIPIDTADSIQYQPNNQAVIPRIITHCDCGKHYGHMAMDYGPCLEGAPDTHVYTRYRPELEAFRKQHETSLQTDLSAFAFIKE